MESIKALYKIGRGPSSSHTMGPTIASIKFLESNKNVDSFKVTLYGSLATTGKGHYTDVAILDVLGRDRCEVIFDYNREYSYHPNGMLFEAFKNGNLIDSKLVFSVGGGSLKSLNEARDESLDKTYPHKSMNQILSYCDENNLSLVDYVVKYEGNDIYEYMNTIYEQMKSSVAKGLYETGTFPGRLNVERKAFTFYKEFLRTNNFNILVQAASLAVSEVNGSAGMVVTAPTCGSSGVIPGILYAEEICHNVSRQKILNALLVGGLIGNIVKTNASISGAEVGCQGEVGVACSMGAAISAYLQGGSNEVIEYAAEIALEHNLGMTCDPIDGKVLIPCIERNAVAATKSLSIAEYAMISGGKHYISFDHVVKVMKETGKDIMEKYRETSKGGLAKYDE